MRSQTGHQQKLFLKVKMTNDIISAEAQNQLNSLRIGIYDNNFETEILLANLIGLGVQEIGMFGKREDRLINDNLLLENNHLLDLYFQDYGEAYDFTIGKGKDFTINQKGIAGGIEACIIADEIRKQFAPIGEFDSRLNCQLDLQNKPVSKKKVLAIGAGGIGNYFCLGAQYLGHDVTLVDFDVFESKNSNRQIFCEVGRPKVDVISENLSCVRGINAKFDEEFISQMGQYVPEVVVGCVDNIPTRNLIQEYAKENNILYYDGGVETIFGQILLNPDQIDDPKTKVSKENRSCQFKPNPSVVIPNCIIGLKLAECAGQIYSEYEFYFDSTMTNRIREEIK